jgi:ABC-type multidrug transport system fused ATPase/permease subunit
MQSLIRTEFQECTVITVAHRIDTILDYDRVVVVDNGKVAQVGSPTELLGQDSAFKRLFEACMTDRLESGKGKGKAAEV